MRIVQDLKEVARRESLTRKRQQGCRQSGIESLYQRGVIRGVAFASLRRFGRNSLEELVMGVLAERFQHSIAAPAVREVHPHEQRFLNQLEDRIQHVFDWHTLTNADGFSRF